MEADFKKSKFKADVQGAFFNFACACGENIFHVETFLHLTDCLVQIGCGEISPPGKYGENLSSGGMWRKYVMLRNLSNLC